MPTFEEVKKMNLIHAALESTQDLKMMTRFINIAMMEYPDAHVDMFNHFFPLVREALEIFEEESRKAA